MMERMHKVPMDEVPRAKENGVRWLITSGASTKSEAIALAKRFISNVEAAKSKVLLPSPEEGE